MQLHKKQKPAAQGCIGLLSRCKYFLKSFYIFDTSNRYVFKDHWGRYILKSFHQTKSMRSFSLFFFGRRRGAREGFLCVVVFCLKIGEMVLRFK